QLASYFGLPISTTHAIVGAVFGFGLCIGGVDAVYWTELGWIASSWVISPLLSGCLSYGIFYLIQRKILFALDPIGATQRLAPFLIFLCFTVAAMSFVYHGLSFDLSFATLFSLSCLVGLTAALLSRPFLL